MLRDITPVVRKSDTGLIAYVRTLQYILEISDSVEKSFGLVEFGLNEHDRHIPVERQSTDGDNYTSLQPDGSVDSFSFIYIKGPVVVDNYNDPSGVRNNEVKLSIIVYGTGDKHYIEEIEKIQKQLVAFGDFTIDKIFTNGKDAYIDFNGVNTKDRHFYSPHYCFRFEGDLVYPTGDDCHIPFLVKTANKIE